MTCHENKEVLDWRSGGSHPASWHWWGYRDCGDHLPRRGLLLVLWEAGNYNISGRVNDMDGSSGSCWMTTYDIATNVMFHKTCEDINNWPDACSKWHNHY